MFFCGFMLKNCHCGVGLALQLVQRETDKRLCCGAAQDTGEETLQGVKMNKKRAGELHKQLPVMMT